MNKQNADQSRSSSGGGLDENRLSALAVLSAIQTFSSLHGISQARLTEKEKNLRRNQARVDKPPLRLPRLLNRSRPPLHQKPRTTLMFHLRFPDTLQSNKLHQRLIAPAIHMTEPQRQCYKRDNQQTAFYGRAERELTSHGDLKDDEAREDTVADHDPAAASRVLSVVHGVKQLVFVHEVAEDEVDQAWEDDLPGGAESAVDDADEEYENVLGEIKAVAEDGWLNCFGVIYDTTMFSQM